MNMNRLTDRVENIFLSLGFQIVLVGTRRLRYMNFENCYCRITPLEEWNAFVIESADTLQDAEKQILEDGELYYLDTSEDELLRQIETDVKKHYM